MFSMSVRQACRTLSLSRTVYFYRPDSGRDEPVILALTEAAEHYPRYGFKKLVTNAVVLWNTLYMQEALSWMRGNGEETGDEYIARLSPLMYGHINMLGHYTFALPEDILKGEMRALNFNLNNELSP